MQYCNPSLPWRLVNRRRAVRSATENGERCRYNASGRPLCRQIEYPAPPKARLAQVAPPLTFYALNFLKNLQLFSHEGVNHE